MATGMSVYVNIGGRLSPSLARAVAGAKGEVKSLETTLAKVGAGISAPFLAARRHIDATAKRMEKVQRTGQRLSMGVAAPAAFGAASMLKSARERSRVGNDMEGIGDLTKDQRRAAEKRADELAPIYGPAVNLMRATTEITKAGFAFDSALASLPSIAEGARIAGDGMTMAQVGENVGKTIAQFDMSMSSAEKAAQSARRVVDLVSYTANASVASFKDVSEGLKWVGPLAHNLGASIEQTTGMLFTLARKGILGSEAGNVLRSDYVRLARPTKGALAAEKGLGIDRSKFITGGTLTGSGASRALKGLGYDVGSKVLDGMIAAHKGDPLGLENAVANHLFKKMGVTDEQDKQVVRDRVGEGLVPPGTRIDMPGYFKALKEAGASPSQLATIFEGRHISRNTTLLNGDIGGDISEVSSKAPGYTEQAFAKLNQGLDAAMTRWEASWAELSNTLTQAVMPQILSLTQAMTDFTKTLSALNPKILSTGIGLAAAAAAAGPLAFVLGGIGRVAAVALGGAATAVAATATGIVSSFAMIGGGAMLALTRIRAFAAGALVLGSVGGLRAVLVGLATAPFAMIGAGLRGVAAGMWAIVANPVGLVITGIVVALTALGVWIANNASGIATFFKTFGEVFLEGIGGANGPLGTLVGYLRDAATWLGNLLGPIDASGEAWKAWGASVGLAAAQGVNTVVGYIKTLIGWIETLVGWAGKAGSAIASMWSAPKVLPNAPKVAPLAGARALGGPVSYGKPYLVGERGPELFVPGASGNIETNNTLRRLTADGAAAVAGSTTTTTTNHGPVTLSPTFVINGADNPAAVERQIEQYMQRLMAEQRGLLSD